MSVTAPTTRGTPATQSSGGGRSAWLSILLLGAVDEGSKGEIDPARFVAG